MDVDKNSIIQRGCLFFGILSINSVLLAAPNVRYVTNAYSGRPDAIIPVSTATILSGNNVTVIDNGNNSVTISASGGSSSSSVLAITTGTLSSYDNPPISSPTAVAVFLQSQFNETASGTTAYISINTSSITALGASPNLSNLSGTLQASQEPAHTGDVTNNAGSLAMVAAATQGNITNFTHALTNTSSVTVNSTLQTSTLTITQGLYLTGIHSVNANYTAVSTDTVILASATITGITITLPAATGTGHDITIIKVDNDSYTVTINGKGSDLIQGTGTVTLNGYRQSDQMQDTDTGNWSAWGTGIQITPPAIGCANAISMNNVAGAVVSASSNSVICSMYTPVPIFVVKACVSIGTSNGNLDIGWYNLNGLLINHLGSTVSPGTSLQCFSLTSPWSIPAGSFYSGIYANNTTITMSRVGAQSSASVQQFTNSGGSSLLSSLTPGSGTTSQSTLALVFLLAGGSTF